LQILHYNSPSVIPAKAGMTEGERG